MTLALFILAAFPAAGMGAAPAASVSPHSSNTTEEIRQSLAEGVAARRRGEHSLAYRLFRNANDLADPPTLQTLSQLGLAECSIHRWLEAEEHLHAALNLVKVPNGGPEKATLESALAEARKHVGLLHVGGTQGATVTADGAVIATLPWDKPIPLAEGKHHLRAIAKGLLPEALDVEIRGEREFEATFVLHQLRSARVAAPSASTDGAAPVDSFPVKTVLGFALGAAGAGPLAVGALLLRYDHNWLVGGLLAGGGLAALAAGTLLYWNGVHSEKSRVSLVLAPTTIGVQGRF